MPVWSHYLCIVRMSLWACMIMYHPIYKAQKGLGRAGLPGATTVARIWEELVEFRGLGKAQELCSSLVLEFSSIFRE